MFITHPLLYGIEWSEREEELGCCYRGELYVGYESKNKY